MNIKRRFNSFIMIINYIIAKKRAGRFVKEEYVDLLAQSQNTRLPENIIKSNTKSLRKNNVFLPGHIIYFSPHNKSINLTVIYKKRCILKNMTPHGTSAIDIYKVYGNEYTFINSFSPQKKNDMYMKISIDGLNDGEILGILLPGYAKIENIFIKNSDGLFLSDHHNYCGTVSIYGSSITQGCASSRPGLSFPNLLMTKYGYKVYNFGFSESAKGEDNVIKYIANTHSNIFVLEYDHNATIEELSKTHISAYKVIREENPTSLIILLSRISGGVSISYEEEEQRLILIQNTLDFALKNGDTNVIFISGRDLANNNPKLLLSDDRHPNDIGMGKIAEAIIAVINKRRVI